MPDNEKKYGWYSRKQHLQATKISEAQRGSHHPPSIIYRKPDGKEVVVTQVTDSPTEHGTGWDDIQCVGEVAEYVSKGPRAIDETEGFDSIQVLPPGSKVEKVGEPELE